MAGSGKHPHDAGRARYNRHRDRAQLEFDELLIDDFLGGGREPRDEALDFVPVRYCSQKLTDHLSDSAIANAMLDAGVFESDDDDVIPISAAIGTTLFELLEDEAAARSAERVSCKTAEANADDGPPVVRPLRVLETPAAAARTRPFSIRGFVGGFLVGASAAGAALIALSMLF
jgi:hypothetical protein